MPFYPVVANEELSSADDFRRGTRLVLSHMCRLILPLPRSGHWLGNRKTWRPWCERRNQWSPIRRREKPQRSNNRRPVDVRRRRAGQSSKVLFENCSWSEVIISSIRMSYEVDKTMLPVWIYSRKVGDSVECHWWACESRLHPYS